LAFAKKKTKGQENELGIDPRTLTVEQRRELFIKRKKESLTDWRVVQPNKQEELVPFNILPLDHGLRLYGLARNGTVYHIHGDESSGKSTTTYAINREYQKYTGEPVAIFDFERTTKSWYLRAMGLDEDMAYVVQPDSIESAVKDAVDLMGQGVRLFTFDSIPRMRNMVDLADIKSGEAFKRQPGTHARAMQEFYYTILPHLARVNGSMLMVNQTRSRIEMSQQAKSAAKGFDTVTNLNYSLPGGRENRFVASVMIELSIVRAWRPGKIDDEWLLEPTAQNGEDYLANEVRLRSLKNKSTGTGYRESRIWIRPGRGNDDSISIRQYARELKLIANHGKRWFVGESVENALHVFDDKKSAQEGLIINPNEELLSNLKDLVIERIQADNSIGRLEIDDDTQRYLAGEAEVASDQDDSLPTTLQPVEDDEL
jgi:RecA/RadA recombinase